VFTSSRSRQGAGKANRKSGWADGVTFLLILLKVMTIFSPLRIFLPIAAVTFLVGAAYAVWTVFTQSHVTNSVGPAHPAERRDSPHRPRIGADFLAAPGRTPRVTARRAMVVVPTYNEKDNLPILVEQLMDHAGVRVLVVDDQSPDGTGEIADRLAARYSGRVDVIHRTNRRGFGRSYLEGLSRAIHEPVDVICQMDADLSHDPRHLPALLAGTDHADVVIGSRYVAGGGIANWPRRRRVLSRLANTYIRGSLTFTRGTAPAAIGAGVARRSLRSHSMGLCPTATRFWSRCFTLPPASVHEWPKCQSPSSNAARASQSCRWPCSSNPRSPHGG